MAWPSGYPKTLTPKQRVERARNAANSRASTAGLIKALLKKAETEELTEEQRDQLAGLLAQKAGA